VKTSLELMSDGNLFSEFKKEREREHSGTRMGSVGRLGVLLPG